jgi:hypothetical protein
LEHCHLDAAGNLEAEILMLEFVEAATEHGGAGDEDDRESRLYDEQRFAGERGAVGVAAASATKRVGGIGARGEPGRRRAENNAGDQRENEGAALMGRK